MKKLLLAITVVTSLAVTSCIEKKNNEAEKTTKQTGLKQTAEDKIVTSTITNNEGDRLDITFNNTKKTATLIFKGDTIELKQDTMGSGVKYSNKIYVFSDWHGQTELKKDGKSIFKNFDDSKAPIN